MAAHGTRNGRARLTEAQVREVRALNGQLSSRKLAARFDISRSVIRDILAGRTWRHLLDELPE